MTTFEIPTSDRMISEIIVTPEKLSSERCKPRAESSELAGSCCAALPASPMLCWMVTALFGLLTLPVPGWAQATLRAPAGDDPRCVEKDCPTAPRNSEGSADATPGRAGNQAPPPAEAF